MTYSQQQPQHGSGPAAPFAPVPPPVKKKRKLLWIVGGFVGLMLIACIGAVASGGDDDATSATADVAVETTKAAQKTAKTEAQKGEEKTAGLKDAVRDGKFEFTVTGVKCGVGKIGSDVLGQKAQGQFCLVDVQVKNIGKEAQTFADSVQKAFDAKKVEYSADSGAAIYANEDSQVFFTEINPGNTVKGKLVFDVPKGTQLTSIELHDSMFSGGVTVALR
ncbi:DUF4352 domain-containing protein [Actinoplanes sp. NPDC020271]|uniref:DUF4352 domain-containing protein n=1 Tax=Actinoplanes sp. NPDC020271 TaxID=3363896 RepID=UPI00378B8374